MVLFESTPNFLDLIQSGGVVGLLLVILWGLRQRWWVPGWYFKDLYKEKEEWKAIALRSTNLAESLDEIAKSRVLP